MPEDRIKIKRLKAKQKMLYSTFKPLERRIIRRKVVFNAAGFEHLYRDGHKHNRTHKDAEGRLKSLRHAPVVIKYARFVKKDIKKSSITRSGKEETFYILRHIIGRGVHRRTMVVTLRKVGNGQLHFYCIRQEHSRINKRTR